MPVLLYGAELFAESGTRSNKRRETAYNAIARYEYGIKRREC